jgi:hypothetical protein
MSMVTLTIQAAVLTEYWTSNFGVGRATLVLLSTILVLNCFGVKVCTKLHEEKHVADARSCTAPWNESSNGARYKS